MERLRNSRMTTAIMDQMEVQKKEIEKIKDELKGVHEAHKAAMIGDGELVKQLKAREELEIVQEETFNVSDTKSRYYIFKRIEKKKKDVWSKKFGQMDKFKHAEGEWEERKYKLLSIR